MNAADYAVFLGFVMIWLGLTACFVISYSVYRGRWANPNEDYDE